MKATKLGSMQVTAGRGASEVDIDNIEVFSADQYVEPTAEPTVEPTATPTTPTAAPTDAPTLEPTEPTTEPTVAPTAEPLTDKLEITGIDADGKTVNISSTSNEKTAVLIGALYDGGKLVEVSTNGDLQSGKLEFVNDVNSYDIKVFAWDSLAGMKPQYLAAERKKPTSEVQTLSVIKEFPELDAEETETVE
jgi:hypothetical protein